MSLVCGKSESLERTLSLPDLSVPCTVSLALLDFVTRGSKTVFLNKQWVANDGIKNSSFTFDDHISLKNELQLKVLSEINGPESTWDNFIKVVISINDFKNQTLFEFEDEFLKIPTPEIDNLEKLLKTQHFKNIAPLISYERFHIFATYKNSIEYVDKSILLSGCGTGSEALVVLNLGCQEVYGVDIDEDAINFAKKRFARYKNIKFLEKNPNKNGYFDLIISRHVIEHISRDNWTDYFTDLSRLLKKGGQILLDVPNHLNPMEPHTELLFFHYLPKKLKKEIISYCKKTNPNWFSEIKNKMQELLEHKNVMADEVFGLIPKSLTTDSVQYLDNNSIEYNGKYANTIRILLSKK
jgi:SAM-dependent methyltransferase